MRKFLLLSVLFFSILQSGGQTLSNLRSRYISLRQDSVQMDTLSLVPHSAYLLNSENKPLDTSAYILDEISGLLTWNKNSEEYKTIKADSIKVVYRVLSFRLDETLQHKSLKEIVKASGQNPFYYNPSDQQPDFFRISGLTRSGSISRGITFGNNQDVFVNSSLNLQLSGKLSDNVEILAAITDENIPIQPEGNTQQLQDFDKVFIQLSNQKSKLIAGDFELRRPDSYFMNFFKKGQGGYFTTALDLNQKPDSTRKRIMRVGASAAVSKGKFAKNTINPIEGNQGPYKLTGSSGETYIIVLSGTEKVYLDGRLLSRGSSDDYIIDYNIAEITFTAKRMITKDSRIVVEFEYSDKNYARSLVYLNNEFESNRLKLKLNVYSEQDSKNQPLLLELDSARKALMASVGDNTQLAFFPTADSVAFNGDMVLYQKKDTTTASGTFAIYLYSTNADSAYWQVTFSEVGFGKGDYILDINSANGRVFKWIQPVNNISQGNYAPVSLLITPKKQQLFTLGAEYILDKQNKISVESALSNNDVNLFSKKDKANDAGYALQLKYQNQTKLSSDTVNGWLLQNQLNYEYTGKNFRPVERYRNVEFERDWNLGTTSLLSDEHIAGFQTSLIRQKLGNLTYQLKSYNKGSAYNGLMNALSTRLQLNKYSISAAGSYLSTKGVTTETKYIRHNAEISRPIWRFIIGARENAEQNKFLPIQSDSLRSNSFAYQEAEGFLSTQDSSKSKAMLSYKQRYDFAPQLNSFREVTKAEDVNLTTEFSKNPNNTLRTTTTYRVLSILDTSLTAAEPTKTLLNRIDHSLNLWKGVVSASTYYEVGTGQERRQEYYYLEVPAGQGVYAYLGDLNSNSVKDLDEFAVASFSDQAKYIRVFVPTNNYITTRSNQFAEVLTLQPSAAGGASTSGKTPFLYRWSNQLSVRLDKKTKDESLLSSLNPFSRNIGDSSLVSTNSSIRNTLYFNRSNSVFGADATWQENRNKNFLTSGFESRSITSTGINLRWNITTDFLLNLGLEKGTKRNSSDFFSTRNYRIQSDQVEPRLSYQPGNAFRITASYKYMNKINKEGSIGENAKSHRFGLDMKFNTVNSGSLTAKVSMVDIKYNAPDDSYLSYELLEGLKNGKNYTWNVSLQRNVSNSIQLSLNYDGRKLQSAKTIHTGGVQVRAFF